MVRTWSSSEYRHFRLVQDKERVAVTDEHGIDERMVTVAYGDDYEQLEAFVRDLRPARGSVVLPLGPHATSSAKDTGSAPTRLAPPSFSQVVGRAGLFDELDVMRVGAPIVAIEGLSGSKIRRERMRNSRVVGALPQSRSSSSARMRRGRAARPEPPKGELPPRSTCDHPVPDRVQRTVGRPRSARRSLKAAR